MVPIAPFGWQADLARSWNPSTPIDFYIVSGAGLWADLLSSLVVALVFNYLANKHRQTVGIVIAHATGFVIGFLLFALRVRPWIPD